MHHVIIGSGPAGITAAETLRKRNANARVTVLVGEPEPPYSRMAIPYLLEGKIAEKGTYLRQDKNHYQDHDIATVRATATGFLLGQKRISLSNGDHIDYDKALICTGSTPVRPDIAGLDLPGVHTCWTLADARKIMALATKGAPVVLLGAGFIGSIVLEALAKTGAKLTVVEMGDRMVPRMLDEVAGGMLKAWCEEQGVRVITSTKVTGVEKAAGGLTIALDNGEKLDAKLFVVAAGVRANISMLASSGVKTKRGVLVDDHMRTSAPDVYAAGDVAEGRHFPDNSFDVIAIQPVAVEHGYIAAQNMSGLPSPTKGSVNMNVLDTIGLISSSFGNWAGVDNGERGVLRDDDGWRYLRLEFDGDRLVGGQAVGLTDHIGVIRGLIQTGVRLGAWKDKLVKSPDRLVEAYVATAHGMR